MNFPELPELQISDSGLAIARRLLTNPPLDHSDLHLRLSPGLHLLFCFFPFQWYQDACHGVPCRAAAIAVPDPEDRGQTLLVHIPGCFQGN